MRWLTSFVLLVLAACSPAAAPAQLQLSASSAETRVFVDPDGFVFPEGASLEQIFDRESGEALSGAEAAVVRNAVTIVPPPDSVPACAHTWRHVFVFYDNGGAPLGALAYCMECGAVRILGRENPGVGDAQLNYDAHGLDSIIEAHGLAVPLEYAE